MRKYLVAALALPVLAVVYGGAALRRSAIARIGVAVGLGAVIGLGVMAVARPASTSASRPTAIVPLTQAVFRTSIATDLGVDAPITIEFSTPMAPESVAAAITVEPATPVGLAWDATFTRLTIAPTTHWTPGAYHTVTVQPGALARSGRPLTTPARSVFLTRSPSVTILAAGTTVGKSVAADTDFIVSFDRAIDPSSLAGAVRLDPSVELRLVAHGAADGLERFTFRPSAALAPDTIYRLFVDGVRDVDGVTVGGSTLQVRTAAAPAVVRFRPRADAKDVERGAAISVRFTRSMDRASTKSAFAVTADGKAVTGKIRFAESDRVLVFQPDKPLPYGSAIVATVATSATSTAGTALSTEGRVTFRTVDKPAAPAAVKTTPRSGGSSGGGGGSVGSGSWAAVERYYLGLMNCTRTGGWVTSTGSCSSPGGRDASPLILSAGISDKVSRPYAKLLATRGACDHFIGGKPGDRLRRAGYTNYDWAENLGCRSGNPFSAVLGSHRYFQSEKPYLGGHYVNLMNRKYDRVGIGVWVSSGRVRLVVDFYHP